MFQNQYYEKNIFTLIKLWLNRCKVVELILIIYITDEATIDHIIYPPILLYE